MPVQNYTWSASLDGDEFSIHIIEASLETARQELIKKLETIADIREKYHEIETNMGINEQNQNLVDEKITAAHSTGDIKSQLELERLYGYLRSSYERLYITRDALLVRLKIDISGLSEDSSVDSFCPDAIVYGAVFGETAFIDIVYKEITLREFIMTSFPTITPFEKIVISNP